jgi:single-strand DNA-binding protein
MSVLSGFHAPRAMKLSSVRWRLAGEIRRRIRLATALFAPSDEDPSKREVARFLQSTRRTLDEERIMSNGMNKVFLLGNLGNDPELKRFEGGANLRFRLATSATWRDRKTNEIKERTDWHTLTMWGKRAEALAALLTKGMRVMVEGRLETRTYEANGETKFITEVKVEDIFFAGGPRHERVAAELKVGRLE